MEGNSGQLIPWLLVSIIAGYNLLKSGVGRAVAHLFAIVLNEQPFFPLPVVADRKPVFEPLVLHGFYALCQEVGDGYHAAGGFGLWFFGDLLSRHKAARFGNGDGVFLEINSRPFQGQQLPLSETTIYRKVEQHPKLLRDFFCPFIIAHGVGYAGIIGAPVALGFDLVRLLNVIEKSTVAGL